MSSVGSVALRTDMWRITLQVGVERAPILFDRLDVTNGDVKIQRMHKSGDSTLVAGLLVLARHQQGVITAQPLDGNGDDSCNPLRFDGSMEVSLSTSCNESEPQMLSVRIKNAKVGS